VKLFPQSLFGRNLLVVALILALSQAAGVFILWEFVQKPRIERLSRHAKQHINVMRSALAVIPDEKRAQFLAGIGKDPTVVVAVQAAAPVEFAASAALGARYFIDVARPMFAPDYTVFWQSTPQQRLWLRAEIDGRAYWFGLSAEGFLADLPVVLIALLLASTVLSIGGAWLLQRRIHRPLAALSNSVARATAAGGKLNELPVDESAPKEVQALMQGYNAMVAAIEKSEQDRANMLAGISHDLRTPLTKLRLGLEMLPASADADVKHTMVTAIESADGVINQFIDFARSSAGETAVWLNLNEIIESVAKLSPRAKLDLATEINPVWGYPNALTRALGNLVSNAEKYSDGEIVLRTASVGAHVYASVLDHGPGIKAEQAERLKQPFMRESDARSGPSGSGLGLAIVDRIASAHTAQFDLLPRDGGGLEARLTFGIGAPNIA
jgi:two-component system, OmpR family, osmolarity sensor histidine kinase EnvZ